MDGRVTADREPDSESLAWKVAHASRVSLLVDADHYFAAFRRAALTARRTLFILGWDVDTRTRLCGPEEPEDGYPAELLEFLHALLDAHPELHIYVIAWDFAVIYALERESFPSYRFQKEGHPRLHYVLDGRHPAGASHHQKVVVVDDAIAFAGGLDLTIRRWDTSDHRSDNPRRTDPDGKPYAPFHDVQIAVQGEAARALGELARTRLALVSDVPVAALPATITAEPISLGADLDIDDAQVDIVRTVPSFTAGDADIQEVRASTLHAIASARELLYIENQYFTSAAVTDALIARLSEPDGPLLIMVLPETQSGWLERNSMGVLRERALARLRAHDRYGRLHVFCALSDGACISVHSKVMIVDDHILRVGSSNLSNRSMGLDTECDVVLNAKPEDERLRAGISAVLCHLLGEHLGCTPDRVAAHAKEPASLPAFIASRLSSPRHLAELSARPDAGGGLAGLEDTVADPERPVAADDFVRELLPTRIERPAPRSLLALLGFALPLLFIAGVWQLEPVRELASVEGMTRALRLLRENPLGPVLVCGGFVLATQLFCPVTLLISATAIAFEPVYGFVYALLSAVLSACTSYAIGRVFAKRGPRLRLGSGRRMRTIRKQLQTRGFQATLAARLLPLGNFTMINLLAGMLRVPFAAFVAGNIVGLLPGVFGLTLLTHTLGDTLSAPSTEGWLLFAVCALLVFAVLYGVSRLFLRRTGLLFTRKLGVIDDRPRELSRGAE